MILKIPVEDRVSTYKGRVTLTPVSGEANKYDMVRADEPINVGTPINKELFDSKAYTVTQNATIYVSKTKGNDSEGDGSSDKPYKTIQHAIDSIPKHLGGFTVTIDIPTGTYEEKLSIEGFSAGRLVVGVAGRTVTVREIEIKASSFVELNITNITKSTSFSGKLFMVDFGSVVLLNSNMTVNANGDTTEAITVQNNSLVTTSLNHVLTVSNCASGALFARLGARVSLSTITGSGNAIGIAATLGAIVSGDNNTLKSDFGDNATAGGQILAGNSLTDKLADIFCGIHVWKRYTPTEKYSLVESEVTNLEISYSSSVGTTNTWDKVEYSDECLIVNGVITLVNPTSIVVNSSDVARGIIGKYIYSSHKSAYYRVPSEATVSYNNATYNSSISLSKAYKLTVSTTEIDGGEYVDTVYASNESAYPNGNSEDYFYDYLGTVDKILYS